MTPSGVVRPKSDLPWFIASFLAAVVFGGFVVWLVMPRGALSW